MKQRYLWAALLWLVPLMLLAQWPNVYYIYTDEVKRAPFNEALVLYQFPSDSAIKINSIKPNSLFIILEHASNKKDVIQGKAGQWHGAYYEGQFGYIFDMGLANASEGERRQTYRQNNYKVVHQKQANEVYIYNAQGQELFPLYEGHALVQLSDEKVTLDAKLHKSFVKILYQGKVGYIEDEYLINFTEYVPYWEEYPEP